MAGKGDKPRPRMISNEEYERRWERTFREARVTNRVTTGRDSEKQKGAAEGGSP